MTNGNESAQPGITTNLGYSDGQYYPDTYSTGGLTKREYFAAQMMGVERRASDIEFHLRCASRLNPFNDPQKPPVPSETEVRAMLAVRDADALIAALNKEQPSA